MVLINTLLQNVSVYFADTFKREEGQGFGEYAFIFALVVLVVAGALSGLADGLTAEFAKVVAAL